MADLGTLAVDFDNRRSSINESPVWKKKITLFTDNGAHAEVTLADNVNGILQQIILVFPATTATGLTATLTIDNDDSVEIFASGAKAENATYIFNVNIHLTGAYTTSFDLSADPTGTGHTASVYLRGI